MTQYRENEPTNAGPKRLRATKREMAKRDLRFLEKLAAGVTIEELAASEGISPKWARERKRALLANRAIDPPHEFIKLQIHRLSEAMLVSYSAMSGGNLRAVDQVLKVVRDLDCAEFRRGADRATLTRIAGGPCGAPRAGSRAGVA
jgi:hypothetical protein